MKYDGYLYSCRKEEKTKKITENIIEVIDEDHIIVDFTNYKRPILVDATEGKIEYRPLLNMVISADEVRRAKN